MLSFNRVYPTLTFLSFVTVLVVAPMVLAPLAQTRADVIVENFIVNDDDFFFGVSGTDPGNFTSINNMFPTGPANAGGVLLINPNTVLAGLGNVAFSVNDSPQTRVNFDLGDIESTTLPDATLVNTEFLLSGINSDPDAGKFNFELTANLLNTGAVSQITDLDITGIDATYSISVLDDGLFGIEVTNTTGNPSSIRISAADGGMLNALNFRNFSPDVLNDELTISATRTINTASVPEPTAAAVIAMSFVGLALKDAE